jgi:predicted phosphodiesterase
MKDVYAIGDIHGNWDTIKHVNRLITDSVIISVGDYGIGFQQNKLKEVEIQQKLNDILIDKNNTLMVVRGNHDDPSYFRKETTLRLSNIEFVEDYTMRDFNGFRVLFVGGAVSIDRLYRKQDVSYWKDEVFVLHENKIKECDILITHSSPTWNGPFDKLAVNGFCTSDSSLWDECVKERKDIDTLIKLSKAKKHYCGHFHGSWMTNLGNCYSRILDIDEVVNIIRREETNNEN